MKHTKKTNTSILGGLVKMQRVEMYVQPLPYKLGTVFVTKRFKVVGVPLWKWTHERPATIADMWGRI